MQKTMKITMRSWFATGLVVLGGHAAAQVAAPIDPALGPQVISYAIGENGARQDRDQYECYLWAVKQSGFDPSQPNLAPHQRVVVRSGPPPGADVAAGAVTGAVIGAAVGAPHDAGEGAMSARWPARCSVLQRSRRNRRKPHSCKAKPIATAPRGRRDSMRKRVHIVVR